MSTEYFDYLGPPIEDLCVRTPNPHRVPISDLVVHALRQFDTGSHVEMRDVIRALPSRYVVPSYSYNNLVKRVRREMDALCRDTGYRRKALIFEGRPRNGSVYRIRSGLFQPQNEMERRFGVPEL